MNLQIESPGIVSFHVSSSAEERTHSVQERVRSLIQLGIWDIPLMRFESWLQRFSGREEQYFASCLLDSLIYRPERQFVPALASLMRGPVRWALGRSLIPGNFDTDFVELLQKRPKCPVRLVPVIREDQPPTKSGPLVLRYAKRSLDIHNEWMLWPWQAAEQLNAGKIKGVVLVDDFMGSGKQLVEFMQSWKLTEAIKSTDTVFCYSPVVAHEDGIKNATTEFPRLQLVCAETLRAKHAFFSDANWQRMSNGDVSASSARAFFEIWCAKNMRPKSRIPFEGFGKLELTIGFSHSTPNNTLPVFWQDSPVGGPLLER